MDTDIQGEVGLTARHGSCVPSGCVLPLEPYDLQRVSAPLFVPAESGPNGSLSGCAHALPFHRLLLNGELRVRVNCAVTSFSDDADPFDDIAFLSFTFGRT